jgi:hypothetical protein
MWAAPAPARPQFRVAPLPPKHNQEQEQASGLCTPAFYSMCCCHCCHWARVLLDARKRFGPGEVPSALLRGPALSWLSLAYQPLLGDLVTALGLAPSRETSVPSSAPAWPSGPWGMAFRRPHPGAAHSARPRHAAPARSQTPGEALGLCSPRVASVR